MNVNDTADDIHRAEFAAWALLVSWGLALLIVVVLVAWWAVA